jgi:transposase
MSKHCPVEQRERAVKMVLDHLGEYRSSTPRLRRSARRSGVGPETLRKWVLQAQVDAAQCPGVSKAEQQRIKQLESENRDLKETNEILKAAAIFFARSGDCLNPGHQHRTRIRAVLRVSVQSCVASASFVDLRHVHSLFRLPPG